MTHVHYKFSSKLNYDTVVFDRLHVTLKDLKRQIMGREKLRAGDCDLQITNAQSKEEYKNEDCSIPKGSSVIVRRIPVIGTKSSSSKTRHIERSDVQTHQAFGAYKAMDDQSSSRALPFFSKMANLADVDGSEEDKIKVMMNQSSYGTMNYNKTFGTVLPANYTCYRCGNTGHHIRNCPVSGDKNFQAPQRIKKSTGIPRSFMVEVDDPNTKGAMLTSSGRYAVSTIDSEAYAIGKKERPPFLPQEPSESEDEDDAVSEELLCLICHDLLSDAVVIPCCGNSYCDDCIRNALLDSEDHICPTCSQPDVSPDNLIANKFLRQAVDNFKKEQGYSKSLKKGCGAGQNPTPTPSPVPTPTPSPVPTPPPLGVQSQPWKPPQSAHSQQDPLLHCSPAAETPPVSQVCVAPPTATDPASSPATSSPSLQPEQSHLEEPDKEDEEKTSDDSAAVVAPSGPVPPEDPTEAPAQLIPLVNLTPLMEPPQTVAVNLEPPSSVPAPKPSAPSIFWESSSSSSLCPTGGWNEPNTQQLPPPVSSYPATPPPPLFPSPHFHTFLAAQQPLGSYPPGYPATPPLWALPNLQGSPIPTLLPSASIPALIPSEWFQHQRKKERSPHRGSSHRRSSRSDSKFKSSRSYSRSSSRSRSRSRSHGRSRPHSPYSRHRELHSRSRSSRSYSYGYKRSPTPSSSSDHRKSSHHGRHHSRKSASSSYSSGSRGEHHPREAGAPGGGFPGHLYAQHANPSGSLELDRERYLQWNRDYKEWCDKYFSSYVGHFHQLPIPLLNIPPPPQWGDREGSGNASRAHSDYRSRLQGRRAARTEGRSPPSRSSSDSRSPPSQSSRDSRSTLSQSSSDSRSSPSHSSNGSRSPPSRSSSDRRSTPSKDNAQKKCTERADRQSVAKGVEDEKQAVVKNLENLGSVKHEPKKKPEEGREEESSSPDAADSTDDKRKRSAGPNAFEDGPPAQDEATTSDALKPVQPLAKPDKRLDKERKSREHRNLEGRRRGKHSDSRQDVGRRHKEKPKKEPDMVETERHPRGSAASDSRSERNRKRKGEDIRRSSLKVENSKCLKTNTAEEPKTSRRESPNPFDRKKPKMENKKERKTWPLTERDIWEGGISVKPQKKISININLDGNRKEEKAEKQPFSYFEKTKEEIAKASNGEKEKLNEEMDIVDNEKKESSGDVEIKPDEGDARQKWEKATFKDDEGEISEKKDIGEKKDDFDLWHIALREEEEMEESEKQGDDGGMEASKGEELTDERGGQEGQAMAESTCEEKGESKEDLVEGGKGRMWEEKEEDMVGFESQRSHQDGPNSSGADGSSGDRQEKKAVVKALDGHTEDEPALTQVPRSKGGKEEERDEAQTDALASSLPSSSVSVTSEATTNRETQNEDKRERSVERERGREREKTPVLSSLHQSVAPSSGKDRNDSAAYSDRDRERRRDRDREREKESKRSKEREKGRDKERERQHSSSGSTQKRNPPSSQTKSHDTERRDRRRGGDAKRSPRPSRRQSGGRRRESGAPELPGENTHKSCRGGLLDSKCKDREHPHYHQDPPGNSRHQLRPAGTRHSPQSRPHSRSAAADLQNLQKEAWRPRSAKKEGNGEAASREALAVSAGGERREDEGSDGRTKWAATTKELEEGERPGSSSSSATQEDDGADGRRQEKKRRATPELMEDEELKEEEKSSGEVDDHAKLHAATSS